MAWYNPASWFGPSSGVPVTREPPQDRDPDDRDRERVRGGPEGVVIPAFLPYYLDVTGESDAIRRAYRHMIAEPHCKTALLGKVLAVAALDMKVQPANKKNPRDREVADYLKWNLTERLSGGVPQMCWSVLSGGCIDGHSVCEKVKAPETKGKYAGKIALTAVKAKDVGNDVVLQVDEFLNVVDVMGLRFNAGEHLDPDDFLIYRHLPLYETPTGMSDFRACYSSFWVLDTARKLRAVALERNAMPLLMGTYKTESQKAAVEKALSLAKSRNWVSAPDGAKFEAISLAGSAFDIFKSTCDQLVHEIFLSVQGAYLQSLEGTVADSAGNSQVHRSTADLWVWYLSATVQALFNDRDHGLVKWLIDLNYVVDDYPKVTLGAADINELVQELQIDQGLQAMGIPISIEETQERYGRQPPQTPEDRAQAPQQGQPGPQPGGAPMADGAQVSALTAQPRKLDEPAAGVPAATPFRFSEREAAEWGAYLRNGHANGRRNGRSGPRRA